MVRNTCPCSTDLILFRRSICKILVHSLSSVSRIFSRRMGLLHTCESHTRRSSPKCAMISESSVVSLELERLPESKPRWLGSTELTQGTWPFKKEHQCCHEQACHGSGAVEKLRQTEGAESPRKLSSLKCQLYLLQNQNPSFMLIALSNVTNLSTAQRNLSPPVPSWVSLRSLDGFKLCKHGLVWEFQTTKLTHGTSEAKTILRCCSHLYQGLNSLYWRWSCNL